MFLKAAALVAVLWASSIPLATFASILWSMPGPVVVHENGEGKDILNGAMHRGARAADLLYFKFTVDPLSDVSKEEYSAGFQLFEGNTERLGIGNSLKAWAYSAFNTEETGENNKVFGDMDLHSSNPESYEPGTFLAYELPRHGVVRTIVFKVQFVPNGDDLVTVWIDPDLSNGATEESQFTTLTTHFRAKAKFDQIRLRHHGGGDGWKFSNMAIATSFDDFIVRHFWEQWWFSAALALVVILWVSATVRVIEKRKYQRQLQRAAQERAVERERARIAEDLHDDLGSSLSRISLLSELVRTDKDNPAQVDTHAVKLQEAATQTVRALEEIVWALRPGSDTLQGLVDYIAHFASELFEKSQTKCRLDLPHDLPAFILTPDLRHNIFLVAKEALANALKHAGAKEVQVQIKMEAQMLKLIVADDGKGFDPARVGTGGQHNGLDNMRRRAETLGGTLAVNSAPGKGTRVELAVKLPA